MSPFNPTVTRAAAGSAIEINKVLKNTYILLSMTLLFSAATAGLAMAMNMPPLGPIISLAGMFGLLFLTHKTANSSLGLLSVFAFTGFMGLTLGPMLSYYTALPNGSQLIMTALGGTGVIFIGLSGYALTSKKDFSFMGGFLMAGMMIGVLGSIGALLFDMPMLHLAISAGFVLLMSGLILFETSQIIHGGETNYILATVSLYLAIYNLFISLLHLLTAFGGDD